MRLRSNLRPMKFKARKSKYGKKELADAGEVSQEGGVVVDGGEGVGEDGLIAAKCVVRQPIKLARVIQG